jgi:hypothetical protein
MAQRPILPLTSGIGQVTPVPINVGGAGTAEAEFRSGLKSPYASGINSAFERIMSLGSNAFGMGMPDESTQPAAAPTTFNAIDVFNDMFDGPMGGGTSGTQLPDARGGEFVSPPPSPSVGFGDDPMGEFGGINIEDLARSRREDFPTRTDSLRETQRANAERARQEQILEDQNRRQQGQTSKAPDVPGADTPAKQAAVNALDEYLKLAKPGVAPKDYAEYIKEFGEATGLDVSGQPDNSQALMAFGLALMQNKAGKGFNVGRVLGAVGEAGEKAMPALEKARANARAIRAKAGEYALGRKKEDQAAAMNREDYYIIPRGEIGGPLGVVDAITKGKGSFERLNAYELNNLDNNEDFNRDYEIVKASDYTDLAKEALKTPEAKEIYQAGSQKIPLYSGAKGLDLLVQLPDRNVSSTAKPVLISDPSQALQQISRMEKGLARGEELFTTIGGLVNQTGTAAPAQLRSALVQGLRNLGFDAGGETDPVKQIQVMLTKLKAQNAAEILGESGKTLSDNDRRMVSEIVGEISFTSGDEALLIQKLGMLYKDIIGTRRNEIEEAYATLGNYTEIQRGGAPSAGMGFTLGDDGVYRRQKPPTEQ